MQEPYPPPPPKLLASVQAKILFIGTPIFVVLVIIAAIIIGAITPSTTGSIPVMPAICGTVLALPESELTAEQKSWEGNCVRMAEEVRNH
jgi:hypothetical protein